MVNFSFSREIKSLLSSDQVCFFCQEWFFVEFARTSITFKQREISLVKMRGDQLVKGIHFSKQSLGVGVKQLEQIVER